MMNQQDGRASSSSPTLPDDVVAEILAYLPAKSAGRLRCLSRSWHGRLSSAPFIKLHLRRANGKPKIFFNDNHYQFYAWQPGCAAVTKLMRHDFSRTALLTRPLHGLVLLFCVDEGGYFVCNPSTGEVRPLPDCQAPLKMAYRFPLPWYSKVAYGFGYCSVSHVYKAVRIFSEGSDEAPPSCEVIVLGGLTPVYWRPAASQPPMCVVEEENPAVFLHGHLHFLCGDDGVILTFNVCDETFSWLPGPPCSPATGMAPLRTTELDGCLCVFPGDWDGPCLVWLLRDYAARRWEKLCCIDPTTWPEPEKTLLQSGWIGPLVISSGDNGSKKKIMFGTGTCVVFTVDLYGDGGVPEILLEPGEVMAGDFDDLYSYPAIGLFEESLVTLGSTTEDMVFSSPVTKAWSEVLKWLPARSVLQLSLVCKEWHAMVTTDRFIREHAALHAISPRVMFVSDPTVGSFTHVDRPQLFIDGLDMFRCSQPCHGLNLGSCNLRDYLYNPTTGYKENVYVEDYERDDTSFAGRVALGYDHYVEDHVIVSLAYEEKNMETRDYRLECHVRSLRGSWDLVDPPPRPVAIDVQPAYSNGKIYWAVEPKLGPCSAVCELVAFDTWDREFEVLQGPPCGNHASGHVSILELYGAICMACYDEDKNAIDVWMMKDDDGAWWVECRIELEKFSPEYSSERTKLLCADPSDGRIFLDTGKSLGYYEPKTAAIETIYTTGEQEGDLEFSLVIVQDSLVRPFMKQT